MNEPKKPEQQLVVPRQEHDEASQRNESTSENVQKAQDAINKGKEK